jgi:flagellar motor switch protein FliM
LVYTFVEILFGGKKSITAQIKRDTSKGLTSIEYAIARQISEIVLTEMSTAFESISSTTFSFERLESNPNFVAIARPGGRNHSIKARDRNRA